MRLRAIRTAAEADDVAVRILDVEILRTPLGCGKRLQNRDAIGDAVIQEPAEPTNAPCGIEVLMAAAVPTLVMVFLRFLQVKLQSVEMADGVEAIPRLAEAEAELLVVRDRPRQVVDEKLGGEGRDA